MNLTDTREQAIYMLGLSDAYEKKGYPPLFSAWDVTIWRTYAKQARAFINNPELNGWILNIRMWYSSRETFEKYEE